MGCTNSISGLKSIIPIIPNICVVENNSEISNLTLESESESESESKSKSESEEKTIKLNTSREVELVFMDTNLQNTNSIDNNLIYICKYKKMCSYK